MRIILLIVLVSCLSCSHSYYIVRHAEKAAAPASDPLLSEAGLKRAEQIKTILKDKKIGEVYATNTTRAKSTAQPTADYFHQTITIYGPTPDAAFIRQLKSKKKNILIVGHSNTVDDIVNGLAGEKKVAADLQDNEYNWLYIIKVKGKKASFSSGHIYEQ